LSGARHAQAMPVVSIRRRHRAQLVVRAGLRRPQHGEVRWGTHEAAASMRLTVAAVAAATIKPCSQAAVACSSKAATTTARQGNANSSKAKWCKQCGGTVEQSAILDDSCEQWCDERSVKRGAAGRENRLCFSLQCRG
jgi:putative hemolysin